MNYLIEKLHSWNENCCTSFGAIRIIGRVSLLWLVNQGESQFLQEVYSILESKLLRTYLALQVSIKPWCGVLGRSQCHGCCCCRAVCYHMHVELGLGDMTKHRTMAGRTGLIFAPVLEVGQEKSAWFMVLFFVRVVRWHLWSLLPCLISDSIQILCVWDDEERTELSAVCSFLPCTHLLLESVNPFSFVRWPLTWKLTSVSSLCALSLEAVPRKRFYKLSVLPLFC